MYKESIFNYIVKKPEVSLAFNSLTCALAEVDNTFFDMLKQIDSFDESNATVEQKQLIEAMKEGRFIVDADLDEIAALEVMSNTVIYGNCDTLGLTIAPTLECNFGCTYCYESRIKGIMSKEVQDAIVEYIKNEIDIYKTVSICWYGGEPLLAIDIIRDLSERIIKICKEKNKLYRSYMISNCYLVTDKTIEILKECEVKSIQVTIDGPAEVHDKRRMLKDQKTGTFDKVVENTKRVIESGISVSVRINVDKLNVDMADSVIQIFENAGMRDKVRINIAQVVSPTAACSSIENTCLNTEEYASFEYNFMKKLKDRGFTRHQKFAYPTIKLNHCCADNLSSFVIDHKGNMYKCFNDIGIDGLAVANICQPYDAMNMLGRSSRYFLNMPTKHDECRNCNLLPICMGGCPYNLSKGEWSCTGLKYQMDNILIEKYKEMLQTHDM